MFSIDPRRVALALALLGLAGLAPAICIVDADITAAATGDPDLPQWTYTLALSWSNPTGFDHWVLPIDPPGGSCTCADLTAAITLPSPAGSSDGVPDGCTVDYLGAIECDGDPNSDQEGMMLTFTPDQVVACFPGTEGTGELRFLSDLPPVPVMEFANMVIVNANLQTCAGELTGVFPGLPCDPVRAEGRSWGSVKGLYR